ncbi:MAG: DUF5658 family protein [Phycisphaerales bacterium JB063]
MTEGEQIDSTANVDMDSSPKVIEAADPPVLDEPMPMDAGEAVRGLFGPRPMLFPNAYTWLLLFSALDIMLTWVILTKGGREVNAIAEWVIRRFSLEGMIVYKFVLVLVFVLICELVGRLRHRSGRTLSAVGVAIASVPVLWSTWLLFDYFV